MRGPDPVEPGDHPSEAADVVGVVVAVHPKPDLGDLVGAEGREDRLGPGRGARIDEHHLARLAADQQGRALPDVDEVEARSVERGHGEQRGGQHMDQHRQGCRPPARAVARERAQPEH